MVFACVFLNFKGLCVHFQCVHVDVNMSAIVCLLTFFFLALCVCVCARARARAHVCV